MLNNGVRSILPVSTEEQAKGENIQTQVHNISEYCSRNGISISDEHWYMDDGFSGAERMRDRPEGVAFFWMSWRERLAMF